MPMHAPKGMGVVDQTCLHMGFMWAKGRERGGGGGGRLSQTRKTAKRGGHTTLSHTNSDPLPPPREATTAATRQLGQVCMWFIYTIGDS